jgi:opacity protein-like surface antigen
MKKKIYLIGVVTASLISPVNAGIRPLATVSLGVSSVNQYTNQNITIISPFQNSYTGNGRDTQALGGIFVGIERPVTASISAQLGISYYQNNSYKMGGVIYQFADPAFDNLGYHYGIKSKRGLVEGKLIAAVFNRYHPFVKVGLGQAINKAFNYREFGRVEDAIPMEIGFANHMSHSFSYLLGLGIEKALSNHIRIGVAYQWVKIGKVSLGLTSLQDSTDTLCTNQSHVNEFLFQLSYLR